MLAESTPLKTRGARRSSRGELPGTRGLALESLASLRQPLPPAIDLYWHAVRMGEMVVVEEGVDWWPGGVVEGNCLVGIAPGTAESRHVYTECGGISEPAIGLSFLRYGPRLVGGEVGGCRRPARWFSLPTSA